MSAILEAVNANPVSEGPSIGPNPPLAGVRQFVLGQISARLNSDPALVGSFWAQIGDTADHPDITVLYAMTLPPATSGTTFALLEFVAGETLEEFVKCSDPSACEQEIPLFCRILDAFEGPSKDAGGSAVPAPEFELLDFGVARASASLTSKLHGAILSGPEGTWNDAVYWRVRSEPVAGIRNADGAVLQIAGKFAAHRHLRPAEPGRMRCLLAGPPKGGSPRQLPPSAPAPAAPVAEAGRSGSACPGRLRQPSAALEWRPVGGQDRGSLPHRHRHGGSAGAVRVLPGRRISCPAKCAFGRRQADPAADGSGGGGNSRRCRSADRRASPHSNGPRQRRPWRGRFAPPFRRRSPRS